MDVCFKQIHWYVEHEARPRLIGFNAGYGCDPSCPSSSVAEPLPLAQVGPAFATTSTGVIISYVSESQEMAMPPHPDLVNKVNFPP